MPNDFLRCTPGTQDFTIACTPVNPTWNPTQETCGKCIVPTGWAARCAGLNYTEGNAMPVGSCPVVGPGYVGSATCHADGTFSIP